MKEPIEMKAGDERVLVNGLPIPVDYRIIWEENYKELKRAFDLANVVESKPNEKAALKYAVDAIYFNDNSDYLSGLYGVVRSLTGLDEPSEEDIKKLFKELNPE